MVLALLGCSAPCGGGASLVTPRVSTAGRCSRVMTVLLRQFFEPRWVLPGVCGWMHLVGGVKVSGWVGLAVDGEVIFLNWKKWKKIERWGGYVRKSERKRVGTSPGEQARERLVSWEKFTGFYGKKCVVQGLWGWALSAAKCSLFLRVVGDRLMEGHHSPLLPWRREK